MATGKILRSIIRTNITQGDVDNIADPGKFYIVFGMIGNNAYIIFNISWVKVEFLCTGSGVASMKIRLLYGSSTSVGWKDLIS